MSGLPAAARGGAAVSCAPGGDAAAAAAADGLDYERVAGEACGFIRRQVEEAGAGGVVFGLSGGIDSSVVAHLSARALGAERCLALIMPNESFTPDSETSDGLLVAEKLGIRHMTIPIGGVSDAATGAARAAGGGRIPDAPTRRRDGKLYFCNTFGPPAGAAEWLTAQAVWEGLREGTFRADRLPPNVLGAVREIPGQADGGGGARGVGVGGGGGVGLEKVAAGNLNARLRAVLLYYEAQLNGYLVVGTDDRSEYLIGYFTKYGDGASDMLPIVDLYKTQVQRLGRHLGVPRHIVEKSPSPHLWKGHDAAGELGVGYAEIDSILSRSVRPGDTAVHEGEAVKAAAAAGISPDMARRVAALNRASAHKRALPPFARLRGACAPPGPRGGGA